MRKVILLGILLSVMGCDENPTPSSMPKSAPQQIRVIVEEYTGVESDQVPLGKCIAVPYPKIIKEDPSSLSLLQGALQKAPTLATDDAVWIYLTPKTRLTTLDFVKQNNLSQRSRNAFFLSFDFIRYAGPIKDLPSPMSCVVGFRLGKLPTGRYKVSVMNSDLEYQRIGKEAEATPVLKDRIHPGAFWYQIEFKVN